MKEETPVAFARISPRVVALPDGTSLEIGRERTRSRRLPVRTSLFSRSFFAAAFSAVTAAAIPAGAEPAAEAGTAAPLIGPPTAGGLTADEVSRRAAATSRDVEARGEERRAAEAGVDQAVAAYVPRLSGLGRYTRLSSLDEPTLGNVVVTGAPGPIAAGTQLLAVPLTFPVIVDQYAAQSTLQIPLSDYALRLPQLHAAARGNARAAALVEQASRLRAATDGKIVFYSWARARLQIGVAERAVAQARGHLKDAQAARETGSASKADVLRVEAQVASAELLLARAQAATAVLDQQLRTVMHDPGAQPYAIGEDLRAPPDPAGVAPALATPEDTLVREAVARRPETRALAESAAATRKQAWAVRAAGLPRLDAVGNATYARPNARVFPLKDEFRGTWDVSLQLSWAPTDLFATEASHSATMARSRQLDAQRAGAADAIRVEIAQAVQAVREAEASLRTSERGLAAAEESYRVRRVLFQNGRATSVELTDAETEFSRAQLEAIGARVDRRIAEARLVHAVGQDAR
jgi:outer membrane protein TolC